jgi:hypothetical protein|tara:strand:- start:1384 stop:2376 length:993 start_codon:yes stop_codon:yes gene_type:complete
MISRKLLKKRPTQLGRIKIGGLGKERNTKDGKRTWRPPVKADHFWITTNVRNEANGNFERDDAIHEIIGKKPTALRGTLMFHTAEENFHSEMCQYKGRGRDGKIRTCDGEQFIDLSGTKPGPAQPCEIGDENDDKRGCECKPYSRFHIQLDAAEVSLGYHFFRTTSWTSTRQIQDAVEDIFERFGTCRYAPVEMRCAYTEDNFEGGTGKSLKVGLFLAMSPTETAAMIGRGANLPQIARGEMKRLAASVGSTLAEQDRTEAEEIQGEYFHEEAESATAAVVGDLNAEDAGPYYEEVEGGEGETEGVWVEDPGEQEGLDLGDETSKSAIEL